MVGTVHTDNNDECCAWPFHRTKPTTTLLQHSEKAALPSQTQVINAFCAAEAAKLPDTQHASNAGTDQTTPSISLNSPPGVTAPSGSSSAVLKKGKRMCIEEVLDDESGGEGCDLAGWYHYQQTPETISMVTLLRHFSVSNVPSTTMCSSMSLDLSSSTEEALEDFDIETDTNDSEKLSDAKDEGWDALLEGDEDLVESDSDFV
ncbi:hypothetical protein EDB19DRAFT_1978089 [Suillus lakei]|nr:hypothetical protein EDB19DRAFT_1978089 [Suillus lakei]